MATGKALDGKPYAGNPLALLYRNSITYLFCAMCICASAESVYTLTGDESSPIDLTAMEGYYADRIAGSTSGNVTVSGAITAGGVSLANPFMLIGNGYETVLKASTGILSMPIRTSGSGTFTMNEKIWYMSNTTANVSLSVATNIAVNLNSVRIVNDGNMPDAFIDVDGGKLTMYNLNGKNFSLRAVNGAKVTLYSENFSLGDIMDGASTPAPRTIVALTNASISCGTIYCCNGAREADASGLETDAVLIDIGPGATLSAKQMRQNGYTRARMRFSGGQLAIVGETASYPQVFSTFGNTFGNTYSPSILEVEGADAPIDISLVGVDRRLTGGYNSSKTRPIRFIGTGGFIKRGTGTLTWNLWDESSEASYTGDTVVKEGMVVLGTSNATASASSLVLEAGTALDMAGYPAIFKDATGAGVISNTAAATATLALSAGMFDTRVAGAVRLLKVGDGTLTVRNPAYTGDVHVVSGTVKFLDRATCGYHYYRFKVDATYGTTSDAMQLSEFKLLNGDADVTQKRSGERYVAGTTGYNNTKYTYPPGETPLQAIDGDLATKWDDFRGTAARISNEGDDLWIRLDYADPQPATAYSWATANDVKPNEGRCRDPRDWRVQGSDDGETWIDLDVQTGMGPYSDRKSWVGTFQLAFTNALALGDVRIDAGATLDLRGLGPVTFRSLVNNGGTLLLDDGIPVTLASDGASDAEPHLDCEGDLIKEGPGTVTLHGESSVGGTVRVAHGTLSVRNDTFSGAYGRVSITANRDNITITQISEYSLYGLDGSRVNGGTYTVRDKGTAAAALNASETALCQDATMSEKEKPDKLFDGNVATKLCVQSWKPSDDKPLQFVFRMPGGTSSATGYTFTTGGDTEGARNPVSWTIEGSTNGVDWVTLDVRTNATTPAANKVEFNDGVPYRFQTLEAAAMVPFGTAAVEVAAGATLDLGNADMGLAGLVVDGTSGGGTITRFRPLPNGTLSIVNFPAGEKLDGWEVPIALGGISGAESLNSWSVNVNGSENALARVRSRNGRLVVDMGGTMIMFR